MTGSVTSTTIVPQQTTAERAIKLEGSTLDQALATVPGWRVQDDQLVRDFEIKGYKRTLGFVNDVAAIAVAQSHHPDITFGWGKARVAVCTHDVQGLSNLDFLLATAVNAVFAQATPAK